MTRETSATASWIAATPHDLPKVLELMRAFYAEDHLVYDEAVASRSAAELLGDDRLGEIFLWSAGSGDIQGYAIVTLGFSLEFGGHFVLLDELYLAPAVRGHGAGKSALAHIEAWAAAHHIATVRLEVNHHNEKAYAVYVKAGFTDDKRHLLSKRVRVCQA